MKYLLDIFFEKTKGFYPFFKYCPKRYHAHYINKRTSIILGYKYNYLEPKTFNEKIRWLIYNEKLKLKTILTDKIKVKTYINEKIGYGHYAPIYGIWDNFEDIDFSYLPNTFVLKTNHAWNTNIFIKSKNILQKKKLLIKNTTKNWLKIHYEQYSLEPQYKNIQPKLFIEQFLSEEIKHKCDLQMHCFNGTPIMIEVPNNLVFSEFYDTNWKHLPFSYTNDKLNVKTEKPCFLNDMIKYSKILSEGFSYVRIDFAQIKERAVVFEMTFTPWSAMMPFKDKKFDIELGEILKLPS